MSKSRDIDAQYERCVITLEHSYGFETDMDSSQVLEETGFDLGTQINPEDVVEVSIREQTVALYIVPNVPEDYHFETRTRKEISVSSTASEYNNRLTPMVYAENLLVQAYRSTYVEAEQDGAREVLSHHTVHLVSHILSRTLSTCEPSLDP